MNKEQALSVLVTAVRLANKRGAFEIEESKACFDAIQLLQPKQETGSGAEGVTEKPIPSPYPGKKEGGEEATK